MEDPYEHPVTPYSGCQATGLAVLVRRRAHVRADGSRDVVDVDLLTLCAASTCVLAASLWAAMLTLYGGLMLGQRQILEWLKSKSPIRALGTLNLTFRSGGHDRVAGHGSTRVGVCGRTESRGAAAGGSPQEALAVRGCSGYSRGRSRRP